MRMYAIIVLGNNILKLEFRGFSVIIRMMYHSFFVHTAIGQFLLCMKYPINTDPMKFATKK